MNRPQIFTFRIACVDKISGPLYDQFDGLLSIIR